MAALTVREHLGVTGPLSSAELLRGLPSVEPYDRYSRRLTDIVTRTPHQPLPDKAAERALIDRECADLAAEHPELASHVALARAVIPSIPQVVTGRLAALELYFGGEVDELLSRIYAGNAVADHYNTMVAHVTENYVHSRVTEQPDRPVRVLEVGAGTGGTTGPVLERLTGLGRRVQYTFTDISSSYFRQARRRFASTDVSVEFTAFDLEQDPAEQNVGLGSYDLVIASNVVHATENIESATVRLRQLLVDGGLLLLNEITSNLDYPFLLFGMIPSWWACRDAERLPGTPLLAPDRWQRVLERGGFADSWVHAHDNGVPSEDDQSVIVARAPGAEASEPPAVPAPGRAAVQPAPAADPSAGQNPAGADAALRGRLREVVAAFLAVPEDAVGEETSFTALGVDSLGAIQLVRELETDFGKLPKVLLYEAGTVAALARELAGLAPEACARIAREATPLEAAARVTAGSAPVERARSGGEGASRDRVAIVGMAVRLPGARTTGGLWRNLLAGTDHMTEIPLDRWDWRPLAGDPHREEGRTNSKWGAFVDGVTEFDAEFFGISPREAEAMDPQQRLMLQTAWHAVEDAGHAPSSLHGSDTAVFVGATSHDYTAHLARVGRYREPYAVNGNAKTVLANRISFELGLHGPSEAVDTACSSSLTALHRAVRAVEDGECSGAIVGGVHLLLTADMYVALGQMGALSPDGKCRPFDRAANGFSRGEGAIAVYLKPLSHALADGDTVHALVRGSGVNHGGRSQSLPVPNPAAQASLISRVLRRSETDPRTIGYVEAHGTGTEVGDPIEMRGLRTAFAEHTEDAGRPTEAWCAVGSIKSNMGHLEAAAGLAGVAKAVLALRHRVIPPSINFRHVNPLLELEGSPFRIADHRQDWPHPTDRHGAALPRRAAVSAMGFGGSNAHVILEEYPDHAPRPASTAAAARNELFVLSARSRERLAVAARSLADHLDADTTATAAEVAHTLRSGREEMEWRLAVIADGLPQLVTALRRHLAEEAADGVFTGRALGGGTAAAAAEDLHGLARQWVAGQTVLETAPRPEQRVSLPGYPFAPDSFWAVTAEDDDGPVRREVGTSTDGSENEEIRELTALLDALSRGELTVEDVDLRLVRNEGMNS
ncbi:hypothetical protein N566_06540 [Streptomycetaceae bacterium MP113-05]|nr:hypothetical protein N566_06540 [Streptomycetaceae bacterium MP113-05]